MSQTHPVAAVQPPSEHTQLRFPWREPSRDLALRWLDYRSRISTTYVLIALGLVVIPLLNFFFFSHIPSSFGYQILPPIFGGLLITFGFALAPSSGIVRTFTTLGVFVPAILLSFGLGSDSDLFVLISVAIVSCLWFAVRRRPRISYLALVVSFLVLTVEYLPWAIASTPYALGSRFILVLTIVVVSWTGRLLAPLAHRNPLSSLR